MSANDTPQDGLTRILKGLHVLTLSITVGMLYASLNMTAQCGGDTACALRKIPSHPLTYIVPGLIGLTFLIVAVTIWRKFHEHLRQGLLDYLMDLSTKLASTGIGAAITGIILHLIPANRLTGAGLPIVLLAITAVTVAIRPEAVADLFKK